EETRAAADEPCACARPAVGRGRRCGEGGVRGRETDRQCRLFHPLSTETKPQERGRDDGGHGAQPKDPVEDPATPRPIESKGRRGPEQERRGRAKTKPQADPARLPPIRNHRQFMPRRRDTSTCGTIWRR